MSLNNVNNILIPNVTKVTPKKVNNTKISDVKDQSDFSKLLNKEIGNKAQERVQAAGLHFSNHALKRIDERNVDLDSTELLNLKEAVNKLRSKGGKNSLVISAKAAYIVDVNNNKIVTAVDKASMGENVFTKIDSTMIIN